MMDLFREKITINHLNQLKSKSLNSFKVSGPSVETSCVFFCINKSANALALCHPPSASFCSFLVGQWSSCIFTHDRYHILSDILIEFEVNL